ncbi:MAG: hypothetical protein M0R46_13685 [Candidatus Muirbacterium halophilum]|nr:hypothetical protein [Candidatus Muirbacterium halophilum]
MKYIRTFENYETSILIIVDVQKSFRKFFTDLYLNELKKYALTFDTVYQIWDNHHDVNYDKDYLYDENPDIPIINDLYNFNNDILIEKRYNYDVDVTFYKKILDINTYNNIKNKEDNKQLVKGDYFITKYGTIIVYIGNNHNWFHAGKKLINVFNDMKGKTITMVGGSNNECYEDLITTAETLGVKVKRNERYIYSANYCPIK